MGFTPHTEKERHDLARSSGEKDAIPFLPCFRLLPCLVGWARCPERRLARECGDEVQSMLTTERAEPGKGAAHPHGIALFIGYGQEKQVHAQILGLARHVGKVRHVQS